MTAQPAGFTPTPMNDQDPTTELNAAFFLELQSNGAAWAVAKVAALQTALGAFADGTATVTDIAGLQSALDALTAGIQARVDYDAQLNARKQGRRLVSELPDWGESYTQHGGKGFEDQWIHLAAAGVGFETRNNGHSGSKLLVGEGEQPSAVGIPGSVATAGAGVQQGGWGAILLDRVQELRQQSTTQFSDTPQAIPAFGASNEQALVALSPGLLVYGPNDLAQFGNTQAVADAYGYALEFAIACLRAAFVVGPANTTFFTYAGAGQAGATSFGGTLGTWGLPGAAAARAITGAATITFTLPTNVENGQELAVARAVANGGAGSMTAMVDGAAVAISNEATPVAPAWTGSPIPFVSRLPISAAMAGKVVTLTFATTAGTHYFGGVSFTPAIPSISLVADNPRLPAAAANSWFSSAGWAAAPTDAGAALINAKVAEVVGRFDRYVGIVRIDSKLNKQVENFNPGDVHPSRRGHRVMAPAIPEALDALNVTQAEALASRPFVGRPWHRVALVPQSSGVVLPLTATEAEPGGAGLWEAWDELSRFTESRLLVQVSVAGPAGAVLYPKFSVDSGANWVPLTFDGALIGAGATPIEAVGVASTGWKVGSWWPFNHTPRNAPDLLLGLFGKAGGVGNVTVRSVSLQFR